MGSVATSGAAKFCSRLIVDGRNCGKRRLIGFIARWRRPTRAGARDELCCSCSQNRDFAKQESRYLWLIKLFSSARSRPLEGRAQRHKSPRLRRQRDRCAPLSCPSNGQPSMAGERAMTRSRSRTGAVADGQSSFSACIKRKRERERVRARKLLSDLQWIWPG